MRSKRTWSGILGLGLGAFALTACSGAPEAGPQAEVSAEAAPADEASAPPQPEAGEPAEAGPGVDAAPEASAPDAHGVAEAAAEAAPEPEASVPEASPEASEHEAAAPPDAGPPPPPPPPPPSEPCDAAVCVVDGMGCTNGEVLGCKPYDAIDICPALSDGTPTVPYQCSKLSNDAVTGCWAPSGSGVPANVACCSTGAPGSADPSPFCALVP
jgi:hypothetical protein